MSRDKQAIQRDLNPHKPAVCAMWLWGAEYAKSGLGSMGFWDSLSKSRQQLCRDMVRQVLKAPDPADSGRNGE